MKAVLAPLLQTLRSRLALADGDPGFQRVTAACLATARNFIHPSVTAADVHQMLIHSILTAELDPATDALGNQLQTLASALPGGGEDLLTPYWDGCDPPARRELLDGICQTLHRQQDAAAADRLGVVYTPPAIVRFLVEGTEWLCRQHFDRTLLDPAVEILDPATGTGTFICELLRYFSHEPAKLAFKYRHELRAHEVAVLPYYIAGRNIAAEWTSISGRQEKFPGLRLVDTLETAGALGAHSIGVILGNPPYNSHQPEDNRNNGNRDYPAIDRRVRQTYVRESAARKTKSYDMYVRFFRWATDYLNDEGIVALVTNRSFLESRAFDGFRATVAREFQEIRIVDLGGDVRGNPSLSGATHNVFGIQTGVAISFLVRNPRRSGCRILHARRPERETATGTLAYLAATPLSRVEFETLTPGRAHAWMHAGTNDFALMLPLAEIFELHSPGISTNRDEWVYGATPRAVAAKMRWFADRYGRQAPDKEPDPSIKWSRKLRRACRQHRREPFSASRIVPAEYRPFAGRYLYNSPLFVDEHGLEDRFFPALPESSNCAMVVSQPASQKPFTVFAVEQIPDLHLVGAASGTHCLPLYYFENGTRRENIRGEALARFQRQYATTESALTREEIFHYIYGILHDPGYQERYRANLKHELPAIPFYRDFGKWAGFGAALMALHTGYRKAPKFPLRRVRDSGGPAPLRSLPERGVIQLDQGTALTGIPAEAWDYRLAGRPALEWVLDQNRDKRPRHPTLRQHFRRSGVPGGKATLIDLLMRVTTVCVETMRILRAMEAESTPR